MNALLVGAAPAQLPATAIASLARGAELVVAVDGGAAACLAAGVVPSVLIGDLDSLAPDIAEQARRQGSEVIAFPAEKDVSDLDLALELVRERGVKSLTVTGVLSSRVDHTLASAGSLCRASGCAIAIIEPDLHAWVVSGHEDPELVLAGTGATVSVMAVTAPATVSVSGMRWPLDRHRLEPASSLGLSNVITGDNALVVVHDGSALALSPRVAQTQPAARISRNTA